MQFCYNGKLLYLASSCQSSTRKHDESTRKFPSQQFICQAKYKINAFSPFQSQKIRSLRLIDTMCDKDIVSSKMTWVKKIFVDENHRRSSTHFPFFTLIISVVQVSLLIYTIVSNGGLSPMSENPMARPSTMNLIGNGAKYVPCMKPTQNDFLSYHIQCPSELSLNRTKCSYEEWLGYACNIEHLKGFPYQHYRFLTPIFLHVGLIHLFLNLVSQLMLGIPLERMFGSIRIALIYILSGIGGNLLSALHLPLARK